MKGLKLPMARPGGPPPPVLTPTSWGSLGPFPDTATEYLTLDNLGLHLRVDRLGEHSTSPTGLQGAQSSSWTLYDFTVRFQVDQPLTYRFTGTEPADPPFVSFRLHADGQLPVFSGFPSFIIGPGATERTGILSPGPYTFSGGHGELSGPGLVGFRGIPLQAQFDVNVPEPGALPFLATLVLGARRRRPRRGAA